MILWKYVLTQLSILQLENYEAGRWWQWWCKHPLTVIQHPRKPLVWTKRLVATVLFGIPLVSLAGWVHTIVLKKRIQTALHVNPLCRRIAITGSFGKTSVKEFLYTILDQASYALTTPGSFNTYGGIYRVLEKELTQQHRFFVAELGAYHQGDITQMAHVIQPEFGILTAIGPQHIERFGSQDIITATKFELLDAVPTGKLLVNWDNALIQAYALKQGLVDTLIRVSATDQTADYVVERSMDRDGVHIKVLRKGKQYTFNAPYLFGSVMAENLSLAIAAALDLGISAHIIEKSMVLIRPPQHRLELSHKGRATLVDDAYSSNANGFAQVMEDFQVLPGSKAIVTPGIVELGVKEHAVHVALGKAAASVFDTVILVGETTRTCSFREGLLAGGYQGTINLIQADTTAYWQAIDTLSLTHAWILMENDVSEQYL